MRAGVAQDAHRGERMESSVQDDEDAHRPGVAQELPFASSVGYQVRLTHRLIQRYLQQKIEPHGVTPGMWYFLRALWHQDGLTQRELSIIVGTMEPTTLTAIKSMERNGLVRRERNTRDKRKINVYLTERGRGLKSELLPLARDVVETAVNGFSQRERDTFMLYLRLIQDNLRTQIDEELPLQE